MVYDVEEFILTDSISREDADVVDVGDDVSGQVGNWKHWFTVAQNEEFDQLYEHRMANSKFHFVFE